MKSKLDQIEDQLRSFIEGSSGLFINGEPRRQIARQLIRAMQDSLITEANGEQIAPGFFTIFMHPADLDTWENDQDLLGTLAGKLKEAAEEAGILFTCKPVIQLEASQALQPDEIRISSSDFIPEETDKTAILSAAGLPLLVPEPSRFYLVVNGTELFPLDQTVINIGRRNENHLVIDDARISRNHAQIRLVHGKYILFDLNSTGGTFVNSKRVTQYTLKTGDVISLAGFPLIYGEENEPGSSNPPAGVTSRFDPNA